MGMQKIVKYSHRAVKKFPTPGGSRDSRTHSTITDPTAQRGGHFLRNPPRDREIFHTSVAVGSPRTKATKVDWLIGIYRSGPRRCSRQPGVNVPLPGLQVLGLPAACCFCPNPEILHLCASCDDSGVHISHRHKHKLGIQVYNDRGSGEKR